MCFTCECDITFNLYQRGALEIIEIKCLTDRKEKCWYPTLYTVKDFVANEEKDKHSEHLLGFL